MSGERTIVEWLSYDDAEASGREEAIGGMGGVWEALAPDAYLDRWAPDAHPYIRAIWRALDELGPITGSEHQDSRCPLFDDGKVATFSMRGWGDLVAAWWNGRHPDAPANYCEFAWYGEGEPEAERAERLRARVGSASEVLADKLHALATGGKR